MMRVVFCTRCGRWKGVASALLEACDSCGHVWFLPIHPRDRDPIWSPIETEYDQKFLSDLALGVLPKL